MPGRRRDVSGGGPCAPRTDPLEVGIEIGVDIQVVCAADRQPEALRLGARVVWCSSVDDGYQIGVRFLRLTGETGEYLTMFLRFLAEDISGKAPAAASV